MFVRLLFRESVRSLSAGWTSFRLMSSNYLINQPKYKSFLTRLGLEEENLGVYDGQWFANGQVTGRERERETSESPLLFICLDDRVGRSVDERSDRACSSRFARRLQTARSIVSSSLRIVVDRSRTETRRNHPTGRRRIASPSR